jgi:hypothetical protein
MTKRSFHYSTAEERLDKVEQLAKIEGISATQWIDKAIDHSFICKKTIHEIPTLRPIITKYPAKCHKCPSEIPVGSPAYWAKGVIICMDCFVQSLGDKALASKYLKMRELNKTMRALKQQADHYADMINEIRYEVRFAEIMKKLDRLLDLTDSYLRNFNEQTIKEVNELCRELKKDVPELKAVLSAKIQPIRKRKKVSY